MPERLLVAFSSGPFSARLVRAAHREWLGACTACRLMHASRWLTPDFAPMESCARPVARQLGVEPVSQASRAHCRHLLSFVNRSPTAFHCAAEAARLLHGAGFLQVTTSEGARTTRGSACFIRHAGSLLAWRTGRSPTAGFRIVAAHSDSPCLKLKPHWVKAGPGVEQLDVDVYGRVLLHTWLDRDLGVAGRVVLESSGALRSRLVQVNRPICRIPSLAIHLAPEVNTRGLLLNPHLHLAPILTLGNEPTNGVASSLLGAALGVDPRRIRGHDLSLFDTQPGQLGGLRLEYVQAARLDNQSMCFAALSALLAAPEQPRATCVVALFDHEEVGSVSATGSRGPELERLLSELAGGRRAWAQARLRSAAISADAGHALHPNHARRHDPRHAPRLNGGPIIKTNPNRRYATDARSGAVFRQLCRDAGVPYQDFVNRPDLACGSTLGPELGARLGIDTVDVGAPVLSMHSIREMAGVLDQYWMHSVLRHFFSAAELP